MEELKVIAQKALNWVMKYDAPQDDYDFIVKAIVADICNRGGLGDEWEQIDATIQLEIMQVWREIIQMVIDPI